MPENKYNDLTLLDQQLSDFSDQVINSSEPMAMPLSDDLEIRQLQETILQLHLLSLETKSASSAAQIRENVQVAWEAQQTADPGFLEKIWERLKPTEKSKRYQSRSRRQQNLAIRISAAAVLVILAAFVFLPDSGLSGGSTSGAAVGDLNPWVIIGGLILIIGTGVTFWIRSRRK